ncbi:SPOC like C-terminal domain-containing protein [Rhodofomes roseus]|uniref:ATP-dependent DNA helicase II subunit 2 n=1 Tax=Rhodofomes roseus TaxID=34475 RepID=A0ABQ8KGZ5_9APHY|nr:SPOC like C-terminal domain-containing protein [Rhodofomes roseus]KAH9836702.1 SPOC like C-terminal domain-containing protein [Rhodofomes roseus]
MIFGSEETDNIINEESGGYEHVKDYITIGQPNAGTLAKLQELQPSTTYGDPIDAIIVGVETQHRYLATKRTWTRKVYLLTDGENPIELEDWEATAKKINALEVGLFVIGVDFDHDEDIPFREENKSHVKRTNEEFYHKLRSHLHRGDVGNCDFAMKEISRPDIKETRSVLQGTILRLGDVDARPEEAVEILCKTSKATAMQRPKSWKRFARREKNTAERNREDAMEVDDDDKAVFAQLRMRTEYYIGLKGDGEGSDAGGSDTDDEDGDDKNKHVEKVEKEQLVRGFKYGSSYAPCPDGQFPRLATRKGIDICGIFSAKNFRREYAMSEVTYVWADTTQPLQQVALSAFVQALYEKGAMATARWVTTDGSEPKMGVLHPVMFDRVDCLMFVRMPFAEDVRNFPFPSLENLISKKGERITSHPYLPTDEQMEAMKHFVDAMNLKDAGEKDEDGCDTPWFDICLSYNPAIHRVKQAQFHAAVVPDLNTHPLPPPHPELTKYFDPPKRVLKRARDAIEECQDRFKVREVPKKVARARKDGHVRAHDEDDETLLLDKAVKRTKSSAQLGGTSQHSQSQTLRTQSFRQAKKQDDSETESETEEEEELLLDRKPTNRALPTPAPEEPERGQAPGRIIGSTYPLEDFRANMARGDVVTKAVEDLGAVIKEIVLRPFASRREDEMIQCLRELRRVCLEEDEIDAWNAFLRNLREACLDGKPGNIEFWSRVKDESRMMSLISTTEANELGGKSDVSEPEAAEFIQR